MERREQPAGLGGTPGCTRIEYEPMPIPSSLTANPPMTTSPLRIWRQYSLHWFVSNPGLPMLNGSISVTHTVSRIGVRFAARCGARAGVQAFVARRTAPVETSPCDVARPVSRPSVA